MRKFKPGHYPQTNDFNILNIYNFKLTTLKRSFTNYLSTSKMFPLTNLEDK